MKNLLTIAIIFLASCKTSSISQSSVRGQYYREGKDYKYDLRLNNDSSFVLTEKYFEVNSTCQGKWQYLSTDTILLKCGEEDLSAKLQSGYMSDREKKLIVLNNNKIKLGEVVLKRKRE
jgi:hypothetical protein